MRRLRHEFHAKQPPENKDMQPSKDAEEVHCCVNVKSVEYGFRNIAATDAQPFVDYSDEKTITEKFRLCLLGTKRAKICYTYWKFCVNSENRFSSLYKLFC